MGSDLVAGSRRPLLGASIVGAAALALFALIFANARGAAMVAEQALSLSDLQAAETEARLGQAQLAQALLLAVDEQAGLATEESVDRAIDEARRRLAMLDTLIEDTGASSPSADAYTGAALGLLDRLESRSLAEADAAALEVQSLYEATLDEVTAARQSAMELVRSVGGFTGLAMDLSALLVALIIPASVLGVYRWLARRQLKDATLEAQLHAERQLNQNKDEFIANVSHELRTPLTGISGLAHVLEDSMLEDPETALELVSLIISEVGELSRMVEDLLTAARDTAGVLEYRTEIVDPGAELATVVTPMERHLGSIPVECPTVRVLADPVRFRQIFRNLLANARHHGGTRVRVSCATVGAGLACAVIDNGPGVPTELEPRLFERYVHRGDRPLVVGSIGLGLSIAKVLAEGMGGSISYDRGDGETRFVVTLPVARVDLDELEAANLAWTGSHHD